MVTPTLLEPKLAEGVQLIAELDAAGFPVPTALWLYFIAPPLGMLLAAELYLRQAGLHRVFCAKLHHHNDKRCIFRCRFDELEVGS